jgi:hypothetical protein
MYVFVMVPAFTVWWGIVGVPEKIAHAVLDDEPSN